MSETKEHRVAKEQCVPVNIGGARGFVSIRDYVRLRVPMGAYHGWEWHDYFGPSFCGKSGDPLTKQPGEHHPVWRQFERWLAEGKRVDAAGYAVIGGAS